MSRKKQQKKAVKRKNSKRKNSSKTKNNSKVKKALDYINLALGIYNIAKVILHFFGIEL